MGVGFLDDSHLDVLGWMRSVFCFDEGNVQRALHWICSNEGCCWRNTSFDSTNFQPDTGHPLRQFQDQRHQRIELNKGKILATTTIQAWFRGCLVRRERCHWQLIKEFRNRYAIIRSEWEQQKCALSPDPSTTSKETAMEDDVRVYIISDGAHTVHNGVQSHQIDDEGFELSLHTDGDDDDNVSALTVESFFVLDKATKDSWRHLEQAESSGSKHASQETHLIKLMTEMQSSRCPAVDGMIVDSKIDDGLPEDTERSCGAEEEGGNAKNMEAKKQGIYINIETDSESGTDTRHRHRDCEISITATGSENIEEMKRSSLLTTHHEEWFEHFWPTEHEEWFEQLMPRFDIGELSVNADPEHVIELASPNVSCQSGMKEHDGSQNDVTERNSECEEEVVWFEEVIETDEMEAGTEYSEYTLEDESNVLDEVVNDGVVNQISQNGKADSQKNTRPQEYDNDNEVCVEEMLESQPPTMTDNGVDGTEVGCDLEVDSQEALDKQFVEIIEEETIEEEVVEESDSYDGYSCGSGLDTASASSTSYMERSVLL